MDDKNSMNPSPPRKSTESLKIPSTIEVSCSQEPTSFSRNERLRDKRPRQSVSPGNCLDDKDKPSTLASRPAHLNAQEAEFDSSLSESSDSSQKNKKEEGHGARNALEAVGEHGGGNMQESDQAAIDRLRIENQNLTVENEQLRRLIEAIRRQQEQGM